MGWTLLALIVVGGGAFGVGYGLRVLLSRKSLTSAEAKSKQLVEEAARVVEVAALAARGSAYQIAALTSHPITKTVLHRCRRIVPSFSL